MNPPIINPDTLSAADLFGTATRLVQGDVPSATSAVSAADNGVFQAVSLVLVMVYMLVLLRRADVIRSLVASASGGIMRRISRKQINPADRRNVSLALAATGIITVAMVAVLLTDTRTGGSAEIFGEGVWLPFGGCIAALAAFVLAEYAMVQCIGLVSGRKDVCDGILQLKLLHFSTAILTILPAAMLYIFSPAKTANVWLGIILVQACLSVILFLKESLSLFISQRVSILHWFLYLCGVELLPASLLLAPVLRGSAGV